ncbi:hypothetical protein ILYODFUR_025120 [Ilyodon furcidens]|uniref:Uncharacterized protein n=1 Tax=Ilyodon furcidens TaxID=33524 RepID=A0ABV0V825_9TELE
MKGRHVEVICTTELETSTAAAAPTPTTITVSKFRGYILRRQHWMGLVYPSWPMIHCGSKWIVQTEVAMVEESVKL